MLLDGILLDRRSGISLRRQLAGQLELRILGGEIRPGRRLPSVRRVSELLGLHRNTVAAAYRDLVRRGFASARPGSGVYVRLAGGCGGHRPAKIVAYAARDFALQCEDRDLSNVLEAELAARFLARVRPATGRTAPACDLVLAPSVGFLRRVRDMPRPSIVAVISDSEVIHRLTSAAVAVHAGEGVAYLPVPAASGPALDGAVRLARVLAADFAALPAARSTLGPSVVPLPVISERSFAGILRLAHRHASGTGPAARRERAGTPERSRRKGV